MKKKQKAGLLDALIAPLAALLLGSMLTGRGIVRAGRAAVRAGTGYKNMDHMSKNF